MASRNIKISDLKVADLKRELEERDLETSGRKADLKERLIKALEEEGEDVSSYLFSVPADVTSMLNQVLENSTLLEQKLLENSTKLEKNLLENSTAFDERLNKVLENSTTIEKKLLENSAAFEERLSSSLCEHSTILERKLLDSSTMLEKKFIENSTAFEEKLSTKLENKLLENSTAFDEKLSSSIQEHSITLEQKILENSTMLENNLDERLENFKAEIKAIKTSMSGMALQKSEHLHIDGTDSGEFKRNVMGEAMKSLMKPPQFDGTTSWDNYLLQFEAAVTANGWEGTEKTTVLILSLRGQATYVLQTLSVEERADNQQIVRRLEVRYGQTNFEHVYHSQLRNRYQKSNESLQQFETDIARLVRLAHPGTPENVMERLAVQSFLDGLRDQEMRQALTPARPVKRIDALTRALEFEATKQSSKGLSEFEN